MTDNKFGGLTTWDETDHVISSWNGGWEAPGQDFVIDKEDAAYWHNNLNDARNAYGDPNIRYNTDDTGAERYLQFGDGTRLPSDGTLVYHDSASKRNWINNGDGTFTKADQNFKPTGQPFPPAGYRKTPDGAYAPIDARGNQVGPLNPQPANFPASPGWHETKDGVATPLNTNGDYYEIDPATGQHKYFDKNHNPISKDKYFAGTPFPQPGQPPTGQPPAPGTKAPLQSSQVVVPDGMTAPKYPSWATDVDPDVPNQMTGVVVRLYELFGKGTPAESDLPEFPFSTDTGKNSGIDAYDKVKKDFTRIEGEFNSTAQAYKQAVQHSANVTKAGRDAINNAVSTFNSTAATLEDGDWDGLLQAESTLLDSVKQEVQKAAGTQQPVPQNPTGGPQSPMTPPAAAEPLPGTGSLPPADPMASPPGSTPEDKKLDDLLNGLGAPLGGMPGGMNPLGALGGMNPLGGLGGGNPMGGGGGGSPLSPLADAIKPMTKMADQTDSANDDKKPAITPLNPSTPPPGTPGGTPPAQGGEPGAAVAAPVGATPPAGAQPGQPNAAPAANAATKPTVTLPDGKIVEAPNQQAAQAAQAALDEAAPGGDPAQKAYSDTGVQLPSDGKNMGAKIDPSDMQPGDVLKFHDKTMVAVAPGLVADPTHPGVTHTIADVLKDGKGFEGVFRPTATDPTLSAPNTPPPLTDPTPPPSPPSGPPAPHDPGPAPHDGPPAPHDPPPPPAAPPVPADPPPDSVPLSGPAPGQPGPPAAPPASPTEPQAAPPSPFETPQPPPATRTTRQDRIAAGIE
ncbi:hypothetical protein MycrhDRAFT_5692 [Mycolicibacterium rhodesiae JS60]|nr:hypothetical protein MycrhDRAFT_5692 [Mycolicibacterium rhodesiae JS60]